MADEMKGFGSVPLGLSHSVYPIRSTPFCPFPISRHDDDSSNTGDNCDEHHAQMQFAGVLGSAACHDGARSCRAGPDSRGSCRSPEGSTGRATQGIWPHLHEPRGMDSSRDCKPNHRGPESGGKAIDPGLSALASGSTARKEVAISRFGSSQPRCSQFGSQLAIRPWLGCCRVFCGCRGCHRCCFHVWRAFAGVEQVHGVECTFDVVHQA